MTVPTVVNPDTGEIGPCEGCTERDATIADRERKHHLEVQRLKADNARLAEQEADSEQVKEILHFWRDNVHRGHKNVNIDISEARGQRARWALRKYGLERCKTAIVGVTKDKWAMGHDPRSRGRKYADLAKHIFKDVETFERFEAMGRNAELEELEPVVHDWLRDVWMDIDAVLDHAGVATHHEGGLPMSLQERVWALIDERDGLAGGNVVEFKRRAA